MTWLAWRQLRGEVIGIALLLVGVATFALITGIAMRGFEGGLACLGPQETVRCGQGDFANAFGGLLVVAGLIGVFPLLIGVFVGAPLVARELEAGTHRLAWAQSVTRSRWLLVKLLMLTMIAVAFGIAIAGVMTWWRQPYDIVSSPFVSAGFDVEGVIPGVYTLFALAAGVAAGTLIGRTLPAMAVTVGLFLGVRLPIELMLRPHYLAPIVAASASAGSGAPAGAWVLDAGLVDSLGNPLGDLQVAQTCGQTAIGSENLFAPCLRAHGWAYGFVYQPRDRFWTFQFIEAAIFVGLSALLVAATVVWVRRRLR